MARRKPEWLLKRQYDKAVARNNYYETHVPDVNTTVVPRKMDTAIYPVYSLSKTGAIVFAKVPISNGSLNFFTDGEAAADFKQLGLRVDADFDYPVGRMKGLTPAKLHGMKGTAGAPTASLTPWNTRTLKYSASTTGGTQANYSAPIGGLALADAITVVPTAAKVDANVELILAAKGTTLANGGSYGRLYWTPEIITFSKNVVG